MNLRCLNSFLMFGWLTVGYAVVHLVIAYWVFSILQSVVGQHSHYEQLQITSELEPMISFWDEDSPGWTNRRLDGTEVDFKPGEGPKFLTPTSISPYTLEEPEDWNSRICALNDFEKPTAYWYFIAPPNFSGTGYFSGYGQVSRQHIGYIDTQGFTRERPTPERSFPVNVYSSPYMDMSGTIEATQLTQRNYGAREPNWATNGFVAPSNATLDTVWVLSRGKIYEIRLGSRTVRTIVENRPDMRFLYQQYIKKNGALEIQLIVRTESGVSIIDPKTGLEQALAFGGDFHGGGEILYSTRNSNETAENPAEARYVIQHGEPTVGNDESRATTLMWMDSNGNVEREQEVKLLNSNDSFLTNVELCMSLFVPAPLVSTAIITLGPIFAPNEFSKSKTYVGGVFDYLSVFKYYLVVSIVIGLITGWASRRRERDVFGSSSWFWPLLVGACGWFGWMSYICLRPLPARLPNRAWIMAPPEPAKPLGTEVFA